MKRWSCVLATTAALVLPLIGAPLASIGNPTDRPASLEASARQAPPRFPEGLSSVLLASHEAMVEMSAIAPQQNYGPFAEILLERVPLDAGTTVDGRNPDESGGGASSFSVVQEVGMHVLYIETGEVTVVTPEEETRYGQGESAFVPQARLAEIGEGGSRPTYELRNDSGECATLIRLSVDIIGDASRAGPLVGGAPQRGCGTYQRLLYDLTDYPLPAVYPPELPVRVFIARLAWQGYDRQGYRTVFSPGPVTGSVSLLVESGLVHFSARDVERSLDIRATLAQGGDINVNPPIEFWLSADPGAAGLLFGVVPADQAWVDALDQPGAGDALRTPGPFAPGSRVTTIDEGINIRALPTTESPSVAVLPSGAELTITGPLERFPVDRYDWYPVTDAAGRSGYVAAQFLEPIPD